jgi:hypothetical protein
MQIGLRKKFPYPSRMSRKNPKKVQKEEREPLWKKKKGLRPLCVVLFPMKDIEFYIIKKVSETMDRIYINACNKTLLPSLVFFL